MQFFGISLTGHGFCGKMRAEREVADMQKAYQNITEMLWSDDVTGLLRLCGAEEREIDSSAADYEKLVALAKESKGKAQLKFSLQDMKEGVYVSAYSRKYRVALTPELSKFIEKYNINYTISVNQ